MKTSDLIAGRKTNALVALVQDMRIYDFNDRHGQLIVYCPKQGAGINYNPTTNTTQWGELQLKLKIRTSPMYQDGDFIYWVAATHEYLWKADTLGLAICKAVIASKWGDEIPDDIWEKVK